MQEKMHFYHILFFCIVFGLGDIVAKSLVSISVTTAIAIGNASHAAGTAKAMEMGAIEGAMSSLAIVISGLMTAVVAPFAIWVLFWYN